MLDPYGPQYPGPYVPEKCDFCQGEMDEDQEHCEECEVKCLHCGEWFHRNEFLEEDFNGYCLDCNDREIHGMEYGK